MTIRRKSIYFANTDVGHEQILVRDVTQGRVLWAPFGYPGVALVRWSSLADFEALHPEYVGRFRPFLTFLRFLRTGRTDPVTTVEPARPR